MLVTKKKWLNVLLVVNLVLLIAGIIAGLQDVLNASADAWMRISGALNIVAFMASLYYVFMGFTKDESMFYKCFSACFALSQLSAIVSVGTGSNTSALALILTAVLFALVLIMAVGKDLGSRNSQVICWLIAVLSVANLVVGLVQYPIGSGDYGTLVLVRSASQLLLAALLGIMTYAKYLDKAERGTK